MIATSYTFTFDDAETVIPFDVHDGHKSHRVVQIDFETSTLLVVSEEDYLARDFTRAERLAIGEALWMVL